ncbi:MAG TPA: lysine--tRNA ligase [Pyrinomonadaceae bacterium]|jgi:lysyl-tRNA synthetase class 2|nr:lysine--tRNA ligase [Pyrinomonadaceae bacterium]
MTENNTPFIEDNDQTRARREHLDKIQQLTGNAYPNKFRRTNLTASAEGEDTITSVVARFKHHEPPRLEGQRPTPEQLEAANAELKALGDVRVGGRISVPPRVMGKAAFVHLSDGKERLQIYVRRDDVRPMQHRGRELDGWELFGLLDHGDFIGVEGFLFVTKTGELSVHVRAFEFLAKALLPMPDKLHGISDPEIRQRQRYADLIAGSLKIDKENETGAGGETQEARELTTREVFERRSKIIREMRAFLDERGYIEVETPMLTPIASGAAARPFKTHHNALDIDLFARIAPELYLKRLVVGGFERVYELNRNFRNEGISTRHNPEFTMLEFYCAYMDVNGMMDLCEEMLRQSVIKATGGTVVRFGDEEINFSRFERMTMKEAINKYWPLEWNELSGEQFEISWLEDPKRTLDIHYFIYHISMQRSVLSNTDLTQAEKYAQLRETIPVAWAHAKENSKKNFEDLAKIRTLQTAEDIAFIFEEVAEPNLLQPTFINDFPKPISPLSKASPDDPSVAERFELFINGMECANGFSELNDPAEQYERFREQAGARERGDEEAMQMDTDYVRALAYGMPPAAGIGIGIDRIVMLLTNRRSIRDVILFPHMRPAAAATAATPKPEEATGEGAESTDPRAGEQA